MFSILGGLIAVPAITATTEAIRQGQNQNAREQHRGRKSNLVVTLPYKSIWNTKFDGSLIILKDNKLYIDTAANHEGTKHAGHPFAGYYLPHPEHQSRWKGAGWKGEGMVSTISDEPPLLNWIYVDRFTHEVKYGNKLEALGHMLGPWDCTDIDHRVTFEGWEGFLAVQENEDDDDVENGDLWALYFDKDDNFLTTGDDMIGNKGVRRLQVLLSRRERPKTKEEEDQEREERNKRREAKAKRDQERAKEKAMPVQEVFARRKEEEHQHQHQHQQQEQKGDTDDASGDSKNEDAKEESDYRIVHDEEIDE